MSPIITAALGAVTMLAANGLTLLTTWFRTRWQTQQEHAHHRNLVATASALPQGGQISDDRSDGTWIRLAVTRFGHGEDHHG